MFGHERLDEDGRLIRIEPGGQPVGDYRHRVFVDLRRVRVIAGERVPIGDEMVTLVNVLQLDPVFKSALVIAEVQTTRRAHSANDSLHMGNGAYEAALNQTNNIYSTKPITGRMIAPKAPSTES